MQSVATTHCLAYIQYIYIATEATEINKNKGIKIKNKSKQIFELNLILKKNIKCINDFIKRSRSRLPLYLNRLFKFDILLFFPDLLLQETQPFSEYYRFFQNYSVLNCDQILKGKV